jgi:hypothetical protein
MKCVGVQGCSAPNPELLVADVVEIGAAEATPASPVELSLCTRVLQHARSNRHCSRAAMCLHESMQEARGKQQARRMTRRD